MQNGIPSSQIAELSPEDSKSALGHLGSRTCIEMRKTRTIQREAQRSYGCPIPVSVQGKAGRGLEQPGTVDGVPLKPYKSIHSEQNYWHVMASRSQRSSWSVHPAQGTPRVCLEAEETTFYGHPNGSFSPGEAHGCRGQTAAMGSKEKCLAPLQDGARTAKIGWLRQGEGWEW